MLEPGARMAGAAHAEMLAGLEANAAAGSALAAACGEFLALAGRCASAEARVGTLEVERAKLAEEREALRKELVGTEELIAKSEAVQHLERRTAELSEELTQSYKEASRVAQELAAKAVETSKAREEAERLAEAAKCAEAARAEAAAAKEEAEGEAAAERAAREAACGELEERLRAKETLEARVSSLEAENGELIQRLLEVKEKEIENLNLANTVYRDAMRRTQSLGGGAAPSAADLSEAGEEVPAGLEFATVSVIPEQVKLMMEGVHENGITAVAFSKAGPFATGGGDATVRVWDATRGNRLSTLHGPLGTILDVAFSPDENSVLSASADHSLRLWDVKSGRTRHTLTGHKDKVWGAGFSVRDSNRCASGGADRTIKVWDLEKGYCLQTVMCGSTCYAVNITSDGAGIVSGHFDGSLRLWDYRTGAMERSIKGLHSSQLLSVQLGVSGRTLLSCGRDNALRVVDLRMMEARGSLGPPGLKLALGGKVQAALAPDEGHAACGAADGSVHVYDTNSLQEVTVLEGHKASVTCCQWSDTGSSFVSGDLKGNVAVWM